MSMDEDKKTQLQMMSMQLQQFQQYLQMLEEQTQEVAKALESMEAIRQATPGTQAYVPLTNGIYIKAKIEKTDEFLINVGNNTITAQTPEKAKTLLQDQQQELEQAQERMSKQFSELYQQYMQLQISMHEGQ